MAIFRDIIRAPRFGVLWAEAQDLASRRQYAEAMATLREAYDLFGWTIPSDRATVEANMTAGVIAIGLRDAPLALKVARLILENMNSYKFRLQKADREFIIFFCKRILEFCVKEIDQSIKEEFDAITTVESDVNLSKVKPSLRKNFSI